MWALIQNGTVTEITDINPAGRFHPSLVWVACAGTVLVGDSYVDGVFSSPSPSFPSKDSRIAALQSEYDMAREKLNKAWLAAMIADGANEELRKNAIVAQMNALDEQLELDIMSVISEE